YAVMGTTPDEGLATIDGTTLTFAPGTDFQDLGLGDTREVIVTIETTDAQGEVASADVTITVTGTNDAPTLEANVGITVVDTPADDVFAPVTGVISASDVDAGSSAVFGLTGGAVSADAAYDLEMVGTYGVLLVNSASGAYEYRADDAAVEPLDSTQTETFALTVTDEHMAVATQTLTVTIEGADDLAIAADDSLALLENELINGGDLLADNGSGADSDVDDTVLTVVAVNGSAASVGAQITLASGALLTVMSDGTFDYDPNDAFDFLASEGSGGAITEGTDTFTYELEGGSTATVTLDITGLDSDDLITGTVSADLIDGGIGNDTVIGLNGNDTVYGGDGSDNLAGQGDADQLFGDKGFDTITGGAGFDMLDGGDGNDELDGGSGNDVVIGGRGSDMILGASGSDQLFGDNGSDTIFGGSGYDTINGGNGGDSIDAGLGADSVLAGGGQDTVFGNAGSDQLHGGSGNDHLEGQSGNDRLFGDQGNDALLGGLNNDTLDGGVGDDILTGGGGRDTFVFNNGGGNDTVTDWLENVDDLDFSGVSEIGDFAEWQAASLQVGSDVVTTYLSNSVTIEDVLLAQFDANDFIF
ncbi:VCBS domain-containing protein, partial [Sulfitobacter sp. HNIBRBA2951]|uniref:VCBS domain-containing protein n=1 Tax=Sulfitobacter aquimarinus TaxID=3158557 RepID=UPI0032DEE4B1